VLQMIKTWKPLSRSGKCYRCQSVDGIQPASKTKQ
jgi:hypothetical protein